MAWTVHKPTDCLLCKHHKEEQKKKPQRANSATVFAAAATALNPHFTALMASVANLKERWCAPACMHYALLACVAGPSQTGQQIAAHLFLNILPIIILFLTRIAISKDQALLQTLVVSVQKTTTWHLQGGCVCGLCKKRVKRYKKPVRIDQESDRQQRQEYTFCLLFLPPSRLVVALNCISGNCGLPTARTLDS
jgi:hypothetical protein